MKTEKLRNEISLHEKSEARLSKSLQENETLLRELYHRTKNTLQLIRSYITLESFELKPSNDIERLVQKTTDRIDSISLVHEMLYKSKDLSKISLKKYVADLVELLIKNNESDPDKILVDLSIDDIEVLLDTAIPCGLIINEMATNTLKHAFPQNRLGRIVIRIASSDDGYIYLEYSDDGIGVPKEVDIRAQGTLGIKLIFMIVETQLNGTITVVQNNGLSFLIKIPTNLYEARV